MKSNIGQKIYWKNVANFYNDIVGETGDLSHVKIVNPIVSDFLDNLKGKVVLDAGCGNGYWSRIMAQKAKEVVGVDFTEKLIKIAKKKNTSDNLKFIIGDLRKLSLSDSEFDVVFCNMALMDVDGLDRAIGEMARVLKTAGIMVISITHPCFENPPNTSTLKNQKGDKIGRLVKHYFKTGIIPDTKQNLNQKDQYQHCHYTLSDYLNAFSKYNLLIEMTSEPNSGEIMNNSYSHTPYFLIFKLRKV